MCYDFSQKKCNSSYFAKFFIPLLLANFVVLPAHAVQSGTEPSDSPNQRTQNMPEEDILVTGQRAVSSYSLEKANVASLSPIDIKEIPQSVQIISSDLIADQGALSIAELLANNAGATAGASRGVPFSTAFTQIRGQDVQLFRDGLRDVDFSDIDSSALSSVDHIEVLKGPSGLVFGTGGPGGIVNIVTKLPEQDFKIRASTRIGTRGVFQIAGDVSIPLGAGLGIRITGELERSDSLIQFSEIERDNLAVVLAYDAGGSFKASARFEYQSNRDDNANTFVGLPAIGTIVPAPGLQIERSAYFGEPAFDFLDLSGYVGSVFVNYQPSDFLGFELAARYTQVNFERSDIGSLGRLNPTTGLLPRARFRQEDLRSDQYNTRALTRLTFNTGGLTHDLTAGFEFFSLDLRVVRFDVPRAAIPAINVRAPTRLSSFPAAAVQSFPRDTVDNTYEFFAQDVIRLNSLTLTAALRHSITNFEDEEALPTPSTPNVRGRAARPGAQLKRTVYQLGASYGLSETFNIFAGYNSGFDANDSLGRSGDANLRFDPEFFDQIETGIKTTNLAGITATLAVFELRRKNIVLDDPNQPGGLIQIGEERSRGLEADIVLNPLEGLNLRLGYLFLDSDITNDPRSIDSVLGNTRPNAPRHSLSGYASYLFSDGLLSNFQLGAGFIYSGRAFASVANVNSRPDYAVINLNASYSFGRVRLDATLSNLFDKRYFIPRFENVVTPGDPRQFTLRAQVQF